MIEFLKQKLHELSKEKNLGPPVTAELIKIGVLIEIHERLAGIEEAIVIQNAQSRT